MYRIIKKINDTFNNYYKNNNVKSVLKQWLISYFYLMHC